MPINQNRFRDSIKDRGAAQAIADLQYQIRVLSNKVTVGVGSLNGGSGGVIGQIDGTTNVIANTITAGSIHSGAIVAQAIATGALTAYVATIDNLTLSSTTPGTGKVVLDSSGVKAYDASTTVVGSFSTSDGSFSTTKGTITGAVIQTGGSATGSAGTNKVMMDSTGIKAFDTFGNVSVQVDTNGVLTVARGSITLSNTVPAGTGARVTLDSTGIKGYNASNQNKFTLDATTGLIVCTGVITAQSGSNIPTNTLSGYLPGSANRYGNSAFQKGDGTFDTTGWVFARVTASDGGTTVPPVYGARTMKLVATGAGAATVNPATINDSAHRVVPGVAYTASLYVYPVTTTNPGRIDINWYDATSTFLSATTGAATATTLNTWNRIATTGTAPSGAVYGMGVHYPMFTNAVNDTAYVECFQFEEGDRASAWAPKPDEILYNTINANMISTINLAATGKITATSLDVISSNFGTITAGTVNGAILQTSSTANSTGGVRMDSSGMYAYDTSGTNVWSLTSSGLTVMGSVSASHTLTGATISTAASGARVVLDSTNGIRGIDSGGTTQVQLDLTGALTLNKGSININSGTFQVTTGGALTATSATITGNITATGGTISGTMIVSGTLTTSTSSVAKTTITSFGVTLWDSTASNKVVTIYHSSGIDLQGLQSNVAVSGNNRISWNKDAADQTSNDIFYIGARYDTSSIIRARIAATGLGVTPADRAYVTFNSTNVGADSNNSVSIAATKSDGTSPTSFTIARGDGYSDFVANASANLGTPGNVFGIAGPFSATFSSIAANTNSSPVTVTHNLGWSSQVPVGSFSGNNSVWSWGYSVPGNNSIQIQVRNNGTATNSGTIFFYIIGMP